MTPHIAGLLRPDYRYAPERRHSPNTPTMAYVKLDTGILDSTLWVDREARDVFLTALLMALPHELEQDAEALTVREIQPLGWTVPKGWYGLVSAAGAGIVRRAGLDPEAGLAALERLSRPDPESRTGDHGGRRVVRVSGGFLILNFMRYRERDTTAAERMKRYRERQKSGVPRRATTHQDAPQNDTVSRNGDGVTITNVTQAVSSKQEAVSSKQVKRSSWDAAPATIVPTVVLEIPHAPSAGKHEQVLAELAETQLGDEAVAAYQHFRDKARAADGVTGELLMLNNGVRSPNGKPVSWEVIGTVLYELKLADATFRASTVQTFARNMLKRLEANEVKFDRPDDEFASAGI